MKTIHFFAIVLITAILSHQAAVHSIPSVIMAIAMNKIPEKGITGAMLDGKSKDKNTQEIRTSIIQRQGINVAMPSPRIDHTQRTVVRSTPGILYTACVFDLSQSALQLTTPTLGGYTSVSAFADNTDNFFVQDDRTATNDQLDVTLVSKDWVGDTPENSKAVISPSDKGIVLFRVLIENEAKLATYVERQRLARCTPVSI